MLTAKDRFARRAARSRFAIKKNAGGRPRLCVFRSGRHIYGQIIDDRASRTLAAASSLDRDLRADIKTGADQAAAKRVGALLAQRAKEAGIDAVVFDRGGYRYHGQVKALADGAREAGLAF